MNNKLIPIVLTLVVGIILAGSVLIPVLNDATKTEGSFTNEGYYRMGELDADASYSIIWTPSKPLILTINDEDYNMDNILTVTDTYFTIFASDGAYMRAAISSVGGAHHMIVQCHNSTGNPLLAFDTANTTMSSMSVTIEDGTITVKRTTDSEITVTAAYSDFIYVFNPNGYYMMKDRSTDAYVTDENIIILAGVTNVATSPVTPVGVYGHGTIDDLVIESAYPDDDTVYSNIVVNSEEVKEYIGLNKVGSITFDMTRDETTTAATYSYYLVPYEVTAELSQHLTPGQIALMGAIPIMVIVALLVVAVGVVARRND